MVVWRLRSTSKPFFISCYRHFGVVFIKYLRGSFLKITAGGKILVQSNVPWQLIYGTMVFVRQTVVVDASTALSGLFVLLQGIALFADNLVHKMVVWRLRSTSKPFFISCYRHFGVVFIKYLRGSFLKITAGKICA
ncbi:hypothetical protein OIU77_007844 [Salix suchowensis]|uniref:Uncharacterized protein n=1 Tax=Salix suchowensis TaxID=1278906 RepID=A0ABQ9AIY4_9ROSI|nr:hypothetical protein OIU77_007844 [Salix suchowensis]